MKAETKCQPGLADICQAFSSREIEMVMTPTNALPTTVDAALTFEEKIRLAFINNMELRDTVKLDGIEYNFYGFAGYNKSTDTYHVRWFAVTARKHSGQQEMIGYHDDFDFEDHSLCSRCHPENEEEFWENIKCSWDHEMKQYGVTWNPELTF